MNNKNTILKISRSKYIEESLRVAIIRLDTIVHHKGTPVMVDYYTDSSHSSFDTVFASGVKEGVGRDCYRILSLRQDNIIWGASNNLPDVSNLIHGEKYLYQNTSGKWWIVQIASDGRTRELVELPNTPMMYNCLSDGIQWIANNGEVRRITDIYSKSEIDALFDQAINTVKYVEFDSLTPEQIEQLKGPKGDRGDKGDYGPMGLQGPPGIRGYNGTIENFVVLSESDYNALTYKDPYKFYFTYEDEDIIPVEGFIAYVEGTELIITATVNGQALNIDSTYASYDNSGMISILSSANACTTPTFSPIPGTYDGAKTIEISCSVEGADIHYTLDWSDPTIDSPIYTGPLTLNQSGTIKAKTFKSGMLESRTAVGTYDLLFQNTVETPILTPRGGLYTTPQEVSVSCSTPDTILRYTLDGTNPNETSTPYLEPIIASDLVNIIRVKGFKDFYNASSTTTEIYEISSQGTVGTPIFSISSGTYYTAQTVTIICNTMGAIIRYTLDGTDPTQSSPAYTRPLIISETTTIKAKAYMTGMVSSNVESITIIITTNIEVSESILEDNTEDRVEGNTWVVLTTASVENKTLNFITN